MGNWRQRVREPSLLLASGLVGGLAGAIAAARGPSILLGVVFGLAVAALLIGVDVVSHGLIEKRRLRAKLPPPKPVAPMTESAPIPGPELAAKPAPKAEPSPGLVSTPDPKPEPNPNRVPTPNLQPNLTHQPIPVPGPNSKSTPNQVPAPDPQPIAERASTPEPVPAPPFHPLTTASKSVAVVFIHGLLSSASVWESFCQLIEGDPALAGLEIRTFEYPSPVAEPNPLRRIPDFDMLGRLLGTYLKEELAEFQTIVLVTHSQGGLVAQRHIALELNGGGGRDLARIKRLVMFACPNSGSELAITLRRLTWFWRHPQERQLRPLNAQVAEAHRILTNQVIHARKVTPHDCPIDISVYAGAQDNVVTLASALSVFPHKQTGVLPGDHFTIIQPDSASHLAYLTLRKKLLAVL